MATKNRVDTGALFAGMIGKNEHGESEQGSTPAVSPRSEKENKTPDPAIVAAPAKTGRKPEERRMQVSIYLTDDQVTGLQQQSGYKQKERDKSALARTGIDIVLALSNEEYATLKGAAESKGQPVGEIVRAALDAYYKG